MPIDTSANAVRKKNSHAWASIIGSTALAAINSDPRHAMATNVATLAILPAADARGLVRVLTGFAPFSDLLQLGAKCREPRTGCIGVNTDGLGCRTFNSIGERYRRLA